MPNFRMPGSILSLSTEAADRLLKIGDGDAILLYFSLMRRGSRLAWTNERLVRAMNLLRQNELVLKDTPLPETAPVSPPVEKTSGELYNEMVDGVENMLGRKLGYLDLQRLSTIHHDMGLPLDVILVLVRWTLLRFRQRYGWNRSPRMNVIFQDASEWVEQGIVTKEKANAFLHEKMVLMERQIQIQKILHITSRSLGAMERDYISRWLSMGFDNDAISMAYQICLQRNGEHNWAYMSGILDSWHRRGLHTAAQIQEEEGNHNCEVSIPEKDPQEESRQIQEALEELRYMYEALGLEWNGQES